MNNTNDNKKSINNSILQEELLKSSINQQGLLVVISGPSGAGKGSICKELLSRYPNITQSISVTTRSPRYNEIDCVHYNFIDKATFFRLKQNGELLESAEVYGNYYGSPAKAVVDKINNGQDVLFEIDIEGAKQIKAKYKNAVLLFVLPPSLDILEHRLRERATDDNDIIIKRLACAKKEIAMYEMFDYFIVNDTINQSMDKIDDILKAERCKMYLHSNFIQKKYLD